MSYEFFIARRYLKGVHRGRVRISTIGVAVGVIVLVVASSIMNGFRAELLNKMLGVYGHLNLFEIDSLGKRTLVQDYGKWIELLESQEGVDAAAPSIEAHAVINVSSNSRYKLFQVRAAVPKYDKVLTEEVELITGDWSNLETQEEVVETTEEVSLSPFETPVTYPPLFLGYRAAQDLFGYPRFPGPENEERLKRFLNERVMGARVTLLLPEEVRGVSGAEIMQVVMEIQGVFRTGHFQFDDGGALTSLEAARIFSRIPDDGVESIEVRTTDPDQVETIGNDLCVWAEKEFGTILVPMTWTDRNPVLLDATRIEKIVMSSILTLIVLVAAVGISGTLVMTVLEKTREIGTLMAMGAKRGSIMAVFVINGFLVGFYGVITGTVIGLGICKVIQTLNIKMPGGGEVYVLDYLPVEVHWQDVIIIAIFALLASGIAGIYPAFKAAGLHPVEALRHE